MCYQYFYQDKYVQYVQGKEHVLFFLFTHITIPNFSELSFDCVKKLIL